LGLGNACGGGEGERKESKEDSTTILFIFARRPPGRWGWTVGLDRIQETESATLFSPAFCFVDPLRLLYWEACVYLAMVWG
jgi:hypothetical protein